MRGALDYNSTAPLSPLRLSVQRWITMERVRGVEGSGGGGGGGRQGER